MSKRAEIAALKAFPPKFTSPKRYAKRVQSEKIDTHATIRGFYQEGYEQAEKGLKLSWEDVKLIRDTIDEVWDDCLEGKLKEDMFDDKEYYGEILRRYNEQKTPKKGL